MPDALVQFGDNLSRARSLGGLATALTTLTTTAIDVTDIYRTQIVMAVSSLDHFVHEFTRVKMIEIIEGTRAKTDAFSKFQLSLASVDRVMAGEPAANWMSDAVREKHSWLSFQRPDKIADAIRLVSSVGLWDAVGGHLGLSADDVKVRLTLIVQRRDKIAHEADMDPTNPGFRWPIVVTDATESVDFIERLVQAIVVVVG